MGSDEEYMCVSLKILSAVMLQKSWMFIAEALAHAD